MAATDSIGTTLSFAGTLVAGLTSISPFSYQREALDTTSMAAAGGYMSFIPSGLADPGSIELEGIEDTADTGQDLIRTNFTATTTQTVIITLPSAVTITMSAFVTAYSASASKGSARTFSCTLKVTGAPAFSA